MHTVRSLPFIGVSLPDPIVELHGGMLSRQWLRRAPLQPRDATARGGFNKNVHGARGLLALFVCVFHVACSGTQGFAHESEGLLHAVLISLQFGVEIFFCISGFIVIGALQRARTPGRFLLERATRILPVLWMTLAVIVPLGLLTRQGQFAELSARDLAWVLPANLAAVAGVIPVPVLHLAAWSLSYELLFYVVAASLWWLPRRQVALRVGVICLAACFIVWHPRALFFGVGVLVARTDLNRQKLLRQLIRAPGLALAAFMACWYAVQFVGTVPDASMLSWLPDGRIGLAAVAVTAAVLGFAGLVAGNGFSGVVLRQRAFQWFGSVSYSFYLWHVVVLAVVKRAMAMLHVADMIGPFSQILLLAICLPISLSLAHVSLRLVEQRFAAWLKRHLAISVRHPVSEPAGAVVSA